jgi:inorganic pyrophosphatase
VVVEIPKGSSIKYEIDSATGDLFVDRISFLAMSYPYDMVIFLELKKRTEID